MKSEKRLALFAFLAATLAPAAFAADKAPAAPETSARPESGKRPAPAPGKEEAEKRADRANAAAAMYMHRLLSMNDGQLARSRQVIEKVEKLSPAQRAELRKRLENLRDASPADREKLAVEMREKFGISGDEFRGKDGKAGKPPEVERRGNLLDKHWATLSPDAAKAEREKFLAMTRDEKVAYIKALREKYGLPPEPEREGKKRPEGDRRRSPDAKPPAAPAIPPGEDPFGPQS